MNKTLVTTNVWQPAEFIIIVGPGQGEVQVAHGIVRDGFGVHYNPTFHRLIVTQLSTGKRFADFKTLFGAVSFVHQALTLTDWTTVPARLPASIINQLIKIAESLT